MKQHFFFSFLFFAFLTSFAQDQVKKPLKVGVVLSGGGAKGFAHIGVLKVLDEAGVKISFIGGTSMGAVVGGLYASGYSARQIDSIFKTTDFRGSNTTSTSSCALPENHTVTSGRVSPFIRSWG